MTHATLNPEIQRNHNRRNAIHTALLIGGTGLLMGVMAYSVLGIFGLLGATIIVCGAACAQQLGLHVDEQGVLTRDGKPYRGFGANYYDVLLRVLGDAKDTGYEEGFRQLAEARIPFVRFIACGFWPKDARLYLDDKAEFFWRFDLIVRAAEDHGVGLIPSLFWNQATVCDLVGETCNQWGNPESKTHAYMRRYVQDVVTRYMDSPAIWGWEFGNEFNLGANLPNASEHRPAYGSDGDYYSKPNRETIFQAVYGLMRESDPAQFPAIL